MLTIFSIPEPFTEKIRRSRKNAINSWRRIQPACEIILFGGDENVAEFALETGIRHVPDVARSPQGTPLLSDVFAKAQQLAQGDMLMFSNCDMLYFDDLHRAIEAVSFEQFMMCGRRLDLDVPDEVRFDDEARWEELRRSLGRFGRMHSPAGIDFFIFPRAMRVDMPDLVVGRPGWDSWFIWYLRSRGVPVIDATGSISALHQNHDYTHLKHGAKQYTGEEMQINYRLAGGMRNMLTLREADWVFSQNKVVRPGWPGRLLSLLGPTAPYRLALAAKRWLQQKYN